ncbi:MAG: hypothetical protein Q4P32_13145, partial [Micrococcales bacterium]|nr:hypothetical protein [Micrococcales bacterium]
MKAWHEATWVGPEGEAPRRTFRLGWLWLLIIPAVLIAFSIARFNGFWQYTEMSVTTLRCEQPLAESEPTWPQMEAAGCTPTALGAEVVILDGGQPADSEPETDGTTWTFDQVPSAFSTLGINVTLPESAGRVHTVNAEAEPPEVLNEMNGDAQGRVFSERLLHGDSVTFYV